MVTWGVHWAGGVCSPANPGYTAEELAFQLADSGAKGLVTQLALLETAAAAAGRAGIPPERIVLLGDERDPGGKYKHFTQLLGATSLFAPARPRIDPREDVCFLVYSSVCCWQEADGATV